MDRGSTEVEIHCACAYARYPRPRWLIGERTCFQICQGKEDYERDKAHMEAEIAKQGQAAGADVSKDSGSPASPANQGVDAKKAGLA